MMNKEQVVFKPREGREELYRLFALTVKKMLGSQQDRELSEARLHPS